MHMLIDSLSLNNIEGAKPFVAELIRQAYQMPQCGTKPHPAAAAAAEGSPPDHTHLFCQWGVACLQQ
jgi:hypothetical protein